MKVVRVGSETHCVPEFLKKTFCGLEIFNEVEEFTLPFSFDPKTFQLKFTCEVCQRFIEIMYWSYKQFEGSFNIQQIEEYTRYLYRRLLTDSNSYKYQL
jgi:hypothetical protein